MKITVWAFCAAVLVLAAPGAASAAARSAAFAECDAKSGGVTSDMRDCDYAEENRQDRVLNALYKRAMARRDDAGRRRLRDQQRAWLKQRKEVCDKILKEGEGTEALLEYDGQWLEMTDKRIAELKALASGRP